MSAILAFLSIDFTDADTKFTTIQGNTCTHKTPKNPSIRHTVTNWEETLHSLHTLRSKSTGPSSLAQTVHMIMNVMSCDTE